MMGGRGVAVDHSILNGWVSKYASEFEKLKFCRLCPQDLCAAHRQTLAL
jgi:transposase-like protein